MADVKISQLPAATTPLAGTEEIPLVQSGTTKKATVDDIIAGAGTVTAVTGTAPVVSSGGTTPAISMAAANTTTDGYLTSTDWNTFNGKIGTLTSTDGSVTVSGTGASRDLSVAYATDVVVLVRNSTGSTLSKGTVVYISGATGQTPTVSKALATSDATSAQTLGMIRADIANNATGYVVVTGLITNIDTSAYTDGAQLYLSTTVAGAVTSTKVYAPGHLVYVGVVEYAHAVNGKIFVKVQNGYELDELHNVSAQTPSNGQTLVYNSSTQLWEATQLGLTNGVTGTLPIANGGSGQTTANAAFNALAPSQTGNSGKYLTTDGSNTSWATNPLGTVTSVSGTGTVSGISLSGTVTTSGSLTLGGALDLSAYNGAGAFTTLSASSTVTLSGGTANGVAYLNGSKVLTSGSALTFDGTNLGVGANITASAASAPSFTVGTGTGSPAITLYSAAANTSQISFAKAASGSGAYDGYIIYDQNSQYMAFGRAASEGMRLTSTGLGIGTSSPVGKLHVDNVGVGQLVIAYNGTSVNYYDADTQVFRNGAASEQMRLTSTGLGIGTSSPAYKLDIYSASGTAAIKLKTSTYTAWSLTSQLIGVSNEGFAIRDETAGVNRLSIDTSGNLGIGTSSPSSKLEVASDDATTALRVTTASNQNYQLRLGFRTASLTGEIQAIHVGTAYKDIVLQRDGGNLGLGVTPSAWSGITAFEQTAGALSSYSTSQLFVSQNAYYASGWKYKNTATASDYYQSAGAHVWRTAPSGTAGDAISFTQAMTLDASGNLQLNTTTSKVTQFGGSATGMTIGSATYPVLSLWDTGDASWNFCLAQEGGAAYLYNNANGPMAFYTNATERARIDSSGNLLVGTTNSSASAGSGLKVLPVSNGTNNPQVAIVTSASTNTTASLSLYSTGAAAYRFYVADDGTVYATSTSISGISDQRFKENVQDLDAGLDKIMALKPRKFDWKEGKGKNIKGDRGFIAQEFEQVFPDLIDEWKDPAPEGEEPYKSVRQDLIPVLVKAIQEQQAQIAQLTQRLAAAGIA